MREMEFDANILVADDEQGIRDMLEIELTELGHRVVAAADGTQALARIEEAEFDLVISDIRMPGADGIAVLKAAKASAPDTEVMIITGYNEIDAAIECVRCGAFDLIHKPFLLVPFLAVVDRALSHRRLRISAVLHDACQEMVSEDGNLPLSQRIGRTAMRLLGADDVSVMLLDSNDSLRIVFATGSHRPFRPRHGWHWASASRGASPSIERRPYYLKHWATTLVSRGLRPAGACGPGSSIRSSIRTRSSV